MRFGIWQLGVMAMVGGSVLMAAFGVRAALAGDEAAGAPAAKVRVLIIDGQSNHKWAETTPAIKEMLEKAGIQEINPGVQRSRLEDIFKRMVLEKRAAERGGATGGGR